MAREALRRAANRHEGGEGLLSMVGTPIGNLADASPRVIETLKSADLVLCEDTRVTSRLLASFGIHAVLRRADENVLEKVTGMALEALAQGSHVAFVSDAGMPGVSDPGQRLVDAALDHDLRVEVIPGPSAVTCALVASGLPMAHFFFEGFLPRSSGERRRRLEELASIPATIVIYESPHRVGATLKSLAETMPARRVALVRELTKIHEECLRGTAEELIDTLAARGELRGECVLVVAGPSQEELEARLRRSADVLTLEEAIKAGVEKGEAKSVLARRLAKEFSLPRSEVYEKVLVASSNNR